MIIALENNNSELLDEFTAMEYSLILAENELYSEIFNIYEDITLNESSGLIYIEESIRETIIRYLNKIITSLQKSWENLLAGIAQGFSKDKSTKLKNLNLTSEQISTILVDNFPIYNDQRIDSIKVQPFNYEAMKQFLKDDKTYIGKYYHNIAPKEGEKLKDTVFKYCVTERKEQFRMTKEDLDNIISFLDNYKAQLETVNKDLEAINGSSKAIEQLVNNSTENTTVNTASPEAQEVNNTTESFSLTGIDDTISLLESFFITEADVPAPGVNKPAEPTTGAAAGSNVNKPQNAPGAKSPEVKKDDQDVKVTQDKVTKADKNSQIVKDVQTYMSASTKVLVAKMRLLRIRCRNYSKIANTILNKFSTDKTKEKKENEDNVQNSELKQIKT